MKAVIVIVFLVTKSLCYASTLPNDRVDILKELSDGGVSEVSIIVVYQGAVARLPCLLEVTDKNQKPFWLYSKTTSVSPTLLTMQDKDKMIMEEDGNITIYHVTESNAGVYRCRYMSSINIVILEVIDDDNFSKEHLVPYTQQDFVVFTLWSRWSECSVCGMVGRRRRFGICYVKSKEKYNNDSNNILALFKAGIPCRSPYLPYDIRQLSAVWNRSNEIMIQECQVRCLHIIFESSANGTVIERANNSAGVYSLMQTLPAQPPPPVADVLFATRGQYIVIRCLGTTLRDMPVRWRVGTKWLKVVGERVYVNARDHVIIKSVANQDENIYSCWERDGLAGTIKLFVWEGEQMRWNHHSTLVLLVVVFSCILRLLFTIQQGMH